MQSDSSRQQHRKRSFSSGNFRKRDRQDLICVVCHASAIGYNFDQITCESCKAFFRRNALNNNKLKCRFGTNDCTISLETRKRCKYCRLKKCFEKGLRKEWIMSEEEKIRKKQKIEDNRRLRAISQSLSMLSTVPCSPSSILEERKFEYLSSTKSDETNDDDSNEFKYLVLNDGHIFLSKIEEYYRKAVNLTVPKIEPTTRPALRDLNGIIDVLNEPTQISALRMITFFKLVPEFNNLHEDDRLALVKHNLMTILCFHFCICTDMTTKIFHEPEMINDFSYSTDGLRNYSDSVHDQLLEFTRELQEITSNDHLTMKLLILIMIFSRGADHDETCLLEPKNVVQTQNIFVDYLWNYLSARCCSPDQTATHISRLIFSCLKAHSIAREVKESVARKQVQTDDLAPIMQSVLQIS